MLLRTLIDFCVHRRLAVLTTTLIIAIFGIHAFSETPIEAYPDVTNTQVTVITLMSGYAPEEVERQVTIPLEHELNGTPKMIQMRSQSLFGLSLITITFEDDADSFHSRTEVATVCSVKNAITTIVSIRAPKSHNALSRLNCLKTSRLHLHQTTRLWVKFINM